MVLEIWKCATYSFELVTNFVTQLICYVHFGKGTKMNKFFLQLMFISFLFLPYQENVQQKIQKENAEHNIKVCILSSKNTYSLKELIKIQYMVENTSKQPIYLIVEEKPVCGYDIEKKELQLMLEKVIYTYHLLEFPKLLKVKPKEKYIQYAEADCTPYNLERYEKNKITGKFNLSVSIGYFDIEDMKKINTLLRTNDPRSMAGPFDETQKKELSASTEIEIIE